MEVAYLEAYWQWETYLENCWEWEASFVDYCKACESMQQVISV